MTLPDLPTLRIGDQTINPWRVIRAVVGLAVVVKAVFWADPDILHRGLEIGVGLLLIDPKLFRAFRGAIDRTP